MDNEFIDLRKMQVTSWVFVVVITLASWALVSWSFAWSAFAGGVVSILSFMVASKDITEFLESLVATPEELPEEEQKKVLKQGKFGLILRFWFRIVIIGVILLLLIKSGKVNVFGLILGLSTIVFAVTFTALNVVKHYFIRRR